MKSVFKIKELEQPGDDKKAVRKEALVIASGDSGIVSTVEKLLKENFEIS